MIQRHRFLLEAIAIIVVATLIGILIAFYARILGPSETSVPVVINEIYPAFLADQPALYQWFELYNRTGGPVTLEGWSLENSAGRSNLPTLVLPARGYAIVAGSMDQFLEDHPDYPGWLISPTPWSGADPQNDYLILRDAQGQAVDVVSWGQPAEVPAGVDLWSNPRYAGGAPWLFGAGGSIAVEHSYERVPAGMDRDVVSDFTRQPFPSPGTVNAPSATRAGQLLFIDWTNVASYAGGILFWVAFVYIGLIARRFETLTQQRTFWQAMLFAPSGILVYNIIQAYGFLVRGRMEESEKWWGFTILFVSALVCTALVYLFRQRAKRILEG